MTTNSPDSKKPDSFKVLSETQNVTIGVIAAFIEGVLLQPTLYWKNARAQKLPFTLNPKIIYRGTAASIFNECQMMGLQFGITGFFQKVFKSGDSMTQTQIFTSAVLGGTLTAFFSSPVELVMIQQQRFGGSFIAAPARIAKQFGVFQNGLLRGLMGNIGRDSIYVVGMLGVTPIIQDYLLKNHDMSIEKASFSASMLGGLVSAVPSHPFDIIKTCMQGDLEKQQYKTFSQTARELWAQGGLRRFFNGCAWRTVNVLGTVYIANECRNRMPSLLFDIE